MLRQPARTAVFFILLAALILLGMRSYEVYTSFNPTITQVLSDPKRYGGMVVEWDGKLSGGTFMMATEAIPVQGLPDGIPEGKSDSVLRVHGRIAGGVLDAMEYRIIRYRTEKYGLSIIAILVVAAVCASELAESRRICGAARGKNRREEDA